VHLFVKSWPSLMREPFDHQSSSGLQPAGQESELKDNDIDKDLSIYLHDEAELLANQVAV
jgi:hypothetical protein